MAAFLISLLLLIYLPMHAQDFGNFGETFFIAEQNIMDYLRQRLLHSSAEERERVSQKLIQLAKEPKALKLPNAVRYRCFFFDPSITANEEIRDHADNIIVERGTKYNPLDNHHLSNALLFFDATQASHVEWAKAQTGLWILVKGKPLELEQAEERPVYFDQFGHLSGKLGIQAVPALVSQEEKHLKIQEFVLEAR